MMVYVVMHNIPYDSSSISGIFSTEEKAKNHMKERFPKGQWGKESMLYDTRTGKHEWYDTDCFFENNNTHAEWLTIEQHEVD